MFVISQQRTGTIHQGIVLKRVNTGEADRVVTLLTPDLGKIIVIAKGARKLHSSMRSWLEPGSYLKFLLKPTSGMPIISQVSSLSNNFSPSQLLIIRQLTQVLEMVDHLSAEGQEDQVLFSKLVELVAGIKQQQLGFSEIQLKLSQLLELFGYQAWENTEYPDIQSYVNSLTNRQLRSYEFLRAS